MNKLEINPYLDIIAQELYKVIKHELEINDRILAIVFTNFGMYCESEKLSKDRVKTYQAKIEELIHDIKSHLFSITGIIDIRNKLLEIVCSKSLQEKLFEELIRYGKIIIDKEVETQNSRSRLIEYNNKLYVAIQQNGQLISLDEVKGFSGENK